jgi:AraC-like DNA-binding protein
MGYRDAAMDLRKKREVIEVWHPPDLAQLELRRGFAVARPVPRHWHEEYQFCLVQSGPGEMSYRGSNLPTPPASLFMVHPGEVHSNRCYDTFGCSYRTLFVNPELMLQAASDVRLKEMGLPFFPNAVVFDQDVVTQYLRLHFALERPASNLERQVLLLDFLAVLIHRFSEERPILRSFGSDIPAVRRACDYLVEHYAENVSLERLARLANLSPFHFNRVFSKQFGMPPHAFQTQIRVSRAKALLRRGLSIAEVTFQTGFFDQSHLCRHFKRLVGVSPGQYPSTARTSKTA